MAAILAVLSAVAAPRVSRGGAGAGDANLAANLTLLRRALELYEIEHAGQAPSPNHIVDQLTLYTDENGGGRVTTRTTTAIYGPYLRRIPPLPVGAKKGATGIAKTDGPGIGWIYDPGPRTIRANTTTEVDAKGNLYSEY